MYAIVEIAGHQYKVQKDQQLYVNRLQDKEGDKVAFDDVLLIEDGGNVTVGAPAIDGAQVTAKVVKHLKGDKIIVFKKKRRKGYRKKNGHRQYLTELSIDSIVASGAKKAKKAAPKKEEEKKETAKAAAPVKEKKAEAPKAEKKAEAPKTEKKAAPKKSSSKGDDLKKIEGIGPKIAEILGEAGVNSFAALAEMEADKIREVLVAAGSRYKMFDPTTWPQQAALAADGKWDELKELQDKLDGGKA